MPSQWARRARSRTGLRNDRDWLDAAEGASLRRLLGAFWSIDSELPGRVKRALWRTEYASWLKWGDLANSTLVAGREALLKTEQFKATRQFRSRVPALADELGLDGFTPEFCEEIYGARSEWVHGARVRLFTSGLERQYDQELGITEGPGDSTQRDALAAIARVQDLVRRAVRRCIEHLEFRTLFAEDDAIRARWPVPGI